MADQNNNGYNGNEGGWVKRKDAEDAVSKYLASPAFKDLKDKKSTYVGGRKILRLLSQENAVGLRIYIGFTDGEPQLFITAVDDKESDIFDTSETIGEMNGGLILDKSRWCPPSCSGGNSLIE